MMMMVVVMLALGMMEFGVAVGQLLQQQQPQQVLIVSQGYSKCIQVGADQATLQLLPCGSGSAWEIAPGGRILLRGSNNCIDGVNSRLPGAVQVQPCSGVLFQNWNFGADGMIKNVQTSLCVSIQGIGADGEMLQMKACDGSPGQLWATSLAPIMAQPQIPLQQPPSILSPPPVVIQSPPQQTVGYLQPQISQYPPQQQQQQQPQQLSALVSMGTTSSEPTQDDHYLCICITSKEDNKCTEAVRAACMVGHIPAADCKASFDNGDHDGATDHVIRLIENGARCNSYDAGQSRGDSQLPSNAIKGGAVAQVTAADHYLCVCIASEGPNLDERCNAAVKTACTLGHLPQGSCFASFDKGQHDEITDHILRLIDRGAHCENQLKLTRKSPANSCAQPPCFGAPKDEPSDADHYLCVCLDDHTSPACSEAIGRACGLGHIPKTECDVAVKSNYGAGVTRHVLHLIDHGARCEDYKGMTFTNRKCHCKQSWVSKSGKTMSFPDNCGDPGGEKGFPWCETYSEENCVGEGGSIQWDRCDRPQTPIRRKGQESIGLPGSPTEVDHYLCVCVDVNSNDEVCVAAVKAACSVGHLPAEHCKVSFSDNPNYSTISTEILRIVANGARCVNSVLPVRQQNALPASTGFYQQQPQLQAYQQQQQQPMNGGVVINSYCGKGKPSTSGGCDCNTGYKGLMCEECDFGFYGFPNCKKSIECSPPCKYGSCDVTVGKCSCPINFSGPQCDVCAPGFSGSNCVPDALNSDFSFSKFILLAMFAGMVAAFYRFFYVPRSHRAREDGYSRASKFHDDESAISLAEAGSTVLNHSNAAPRGHAKHTGLAI